MSHVSQPFHGWLIWLAYAEGAPGCCDYMQHTGQERTTFKLTPFAHVLSHDEDTVDSEWAARHASGGA